MSTFGVDLDEVALVPGTGGVFEIRVGGDLVWERKRDGGFPEAKVLKQKVRDIVWPERDLGHSDGHKKSAIPVSDEQGEKLKGGARTQVSKPEVTTTKLDDAARAGWLYYVAGNTQEEIARSSAFRARPLSAWCRWQCQRAWSRSGSTIRLAVVSILPRG